MISLLEVEIISFVSCSVPVASGVTFVSWIHAKRDSPSLFSIFTTGAVVSSPVVHEELPPVALAVVSEGFLRISSKSHIRIKVKIYE